MALEAYIVAFDIQDAGAGFQLKPETGLTPSGKAKVGANEYEAGTSTEPSLLQQGIKGAAIAKLVEVEAESAAEAIEAVREKYKNNAGGERAVVKPHKTNFKAVV